MVTKYLPPFSKPLQPTRTGTHANTYATLLQVCADAQSLTEGKQVHALMLVNGFEGIFFLRTKLLNMYVSCRRIADARRVFDKISEKSVFSWNAMIRGYVTHGFYEKTLSLYSQMQRSSMEAGKFTFPFVLKACAVLRALQQGKIVHNHIIRNGLELEDHVGNALVSMYAKCGCIQNARKIFDKTRERGLVSWTALIAGYAQSGHCNDALELFGAMQAAAVKPDSVTVASILPVCAQLGILQQGKEIHQLLVKDGFDCDVFVLSALINMYAKCASIDSARHVFDRTPKRDVVLWNAMIEGYGMQGYGNEALSIFSQMQHEGMMPNDSTFVTVLSACGHAGLIDEGQRYFDCMIQEYHICPSVKHYSCMADMLGRAGRLKEAKDFINQMPIEPDAVMWGALLGACRTHGDADLAESVAEKLFELEPENAGNYLLLSNIYAEAGRWDEAAKVRKMMKDKGLKNRPAKSWIMVENKVHAYLVGDMSHPQP